jgi:hypothetical protein
MIYCRICHTKNQSSYEKCVKCSSPLLDQPNFFEKVKANLFSISIFLISHIIVTYLNSNFNYDKFENTHILLSLTIMISFGFILVGMLHKLPEWEQYKRRAIRHLKLDLRQAKDDFYKAYSFLPSKMKFKGFLTFYQPYNEIDPVNAQLMWINMIRIAQPSERKSMGRYYSRRIITLGKQLVCEANAAELTGDTITQIRKQLYYSYFLESRLSRFRPEIRDQMIHLIDNIRNNAVEGNIAIKIMACGLCKQLVNHDHDPMINKQLYPIYLLSDELRSVHLSFNERNTSIPEWKTSRRYQV